MVEKVLELGVVLVVVSWRCMPEMPIFGRLSHRDHKFKTSLEYIVNFRPAWDIQ